MTKYYRIEIDFSYADEDDLDEIFGRIVDAVCEGEHGPDEECKRNLVAGGRDVTEEIHEDEVRDFMESIEFKDWPNEERHIAG